MTQTQNTTPVSQVGKQDIANQQERLNQALLAQQQSAQARAAEKPMTWEEFYTAPNIEQPQPIDYKRERARQNIANLTDAINAITAMGTAIGGGRVAPVTSLSQANQQRYMTMYQMREQQADRYNKAVKDAESRAQTMLSLRQQMRDRQNSLTMQAEQARINAESDKLKAMQGVYNQAYSENQDKIKEANTDRRLNTQEYNANLRAEAGERAKDKEMAYNTRLHNSQELAKYTKTPTINGQEYYIRKEDTDAFYGDAWNAIINDQKFVNNNQLADEIRQAQMLQTTNPKEANAKKRRIVNRMFGKSEAAQQATADLFVTPDLWPDDNTQGKANNTTAFVSSPEPVSQGGFWHDWILGGATAQADPNGIYKPASSY